MANNQTTGGLPATQNVPSAYAPTRSNGQEMSFIHQEPPMVYQPPSDSIERASSNPVVPVHEPVQRWVRPLEQLRDKEEDVDCPYCKRAVKTKIKQPEADDDGMMRILICLVCCPLLLCYQGNKHLDHHCSECGRQLTHQPSGSGRVEVVARENVQQGVRPSAYPQSPDGPK